MTEARDTTARTGWLARAVMVLVGLVLCGVAGELASRTDDAVFHRAPFASNPSFDDLFVRDALGRRGRPFGSFKKWHLNAQGFRAPAIEWQAPPGCRRIVIMGASESFGYFEAEGGEYPAVLARRLATTGGCVQVVNAAVVGMTTATMLQYWSNWVSRLHPDVVMLYPSPHFYLANGDQDLPPTIDPSLREVPPPAVPPAPDNPFDSRFGDRLHGVIGGFTPSWALMMRDRRGVEREVATKPADWVFHDPPERRIEQFRSHLGTLMDAIVQTGARVVLTTHAQRASLPYADRDLPDLWAARVSTPRAALDVLVRFDRAGNEAVKEVAAARSIPVIDIAANLNGCWDCFGDLDHFSQAGAERMADLLFENADLFVGTSAGAATTQAYDVTHAVQ